MNGKRNIIPWQEEIVSNGYQKLILGNQTTESNLIDDLLIIYC